MWNLCLLSQYINIIFYSSVSLICVKTLHIKYSQCEIYTTVVQSLYESLMVTEMVRFSNYHVFSTLTLMVKLSKILSKYWLVEGGFISLFVFVKEDLKEIFLFCILHWYSTMPGEKRALIKHASPIPLYETPR